MSEKICGTSKLESVPGAPPKTFLDLPREIRDEIYKDVLIAKSPILIWYGMRQYGSHNMREGLSDPRCTPCGSNKVFTHDRAEGLLKCSQAVRLEAAEVFYGKNTFYFKGYDTWDPLFGFLNCIGERNRNHLRSLVIDSKSPEHVQLHADGTVSNLRHNPWWACKVLPRHHYSYTSPLRKHRQYAEEMSPAIEACFSILGNHGPNLNLTLGLLPGDLPGVQVGKDLVDKRIPHAWPHGSMEMPDLIQKYNQIYSGSRIVVSWQGIFDRDKFVARIDEIESIWEVLEIEDAKGKNIRFKIRRRQLAIDPS